MPVWKGKPLYQSYLIGRFDLKAETLADLAGTVHAFSDPDSTRATWSRPPRSQR